MVVYLVDVILCLVELDCDVNYLDVVYSDMLLYIVCCCCNEKSIEILIKIGVKFNLINNEGEIFLVKLLKFVINMVDFYLKLRMKLVR